MQKTPLAQYSIAELEEYIKARKTIEKYERVPEAKNTVNEPTKPTKIKGKKTQRERRGSLNSADVIAAVTKAMPKGINGINLQKAIGTSYQTLKNWYKKHGKDSDIECVKAEKGVGLVYKLITH